MCMVLYYLINDTINKLLMMMTRKRGKSAARGGAAAAKLDLFWAKADPFFRRKTTVRINEENWWHYDPPLPIFWGAVRTNKLSEFCWWWIFMWRKKSSQLVNLLAFTTPHVIVSIYHFFFLSRLEKKNDIKNNSSYNNFRRNEHRNAAIFSKEAESLFFVINLPGAPFSKRCVARSFYLKCWLQFD